MKKVSEKHGLWRDPRARKIAPWAGMLVTSIFVLIFHLAPALSFSTVASALPSYQLQAARLEFTDGGNKITPAVTSAGLEIAIGSPLEAAPFYFRAIEREGVATDAEILTLLDAVLERDPRHYFARLWRARIHYRARQIAEAVDEVLKVIPLYPSGEVDLVEALVDVARDPENRPILLELTRQQPRWAQAFIKRVKVEIEDEEFGLALASQSAAMLNQHIRSLIQAGDRDRAFAVWQGTLTEEELLAFSWPVDGRFERGADDTPFGWTTDTNTTSRGPDGLNVFYNGRGRKQVLSQTMLLGPGYRYRLALWISGNLKEDGGWFRATITCIENEQVVGEAALRSVKREAAPHTLDFAVPDEGCDAQIVALVAEPGEFTFPSRISVREVRIEQVGRTASPLELPVLPGAEP